MASTIKVKRSSSSGAAPNTTHISTGEIALNTADGILYSSDGSSVFEIGANLSSLSVAGLAYPTSDGSSGQVLTTNGSGTLSFSTVSGGDGDITGVTAGTGLSGGGASGAVTLNIDSTVATLTGSQTLTNKTLTSPSIGTGFTLDSVTIGTIQTSAESFVDNDTSLMTSAAIDDRINAAGGVSALNDLSDAITNSSGQTIGIGTDALANDDGSDNFNTALGYKAGEDITSGTGGVFVGYEAGLQATTSNYPIAIGYEAIGAGVMTGTDNIAIGRQAGNDLTSGVNNIFQGVAAGYEATTGSLNVAIGYYAIGAGVLTGADNIAIGQRAGNDLTSGTYNNFMGYRAGYNATTASNTVAIGRNAIGFGVLTGDNNTAVGYEAGYDLTSGTYNVFTGYRAGGNVTTGADNTILGTNAGIALITGSNNIIIGHDAAASATNVSNEITLGDANITKLRVPGLNFIIKDSTATEDYVLTVDANGEAGWADVVSSPAATTVDALKLLQDDSSYFYTAIGDLYTKAEPSGSDSFVQYNNAGIFGSDSAFTFNDSTNTLSVPNIIISSQSTLTNLSVSGNTDLDIVTANTIATDGNITIGGNIATDGNITIGGGTLNAYSIDAIYDRGILNSADSAYLFTKIEEIEGRNLKEFGDAFTLPTTDGTNGQALLTNGSGTIIWSNVSSGLNLLAVETVTASVAAVDIDIPAGYTRFKLCIDDLTNSVSAAQTRVTLSTDGGSTFISSGDHKILAQGMTYGSTGVAWTTSTVVQFMLAIQITGSGTNAPQSAVHEITVSDDVFVMQGFYDFDDSAAFISNRREMTARVDTIRISQSSGNIATGRIALYGYKETT